MRAEDARECAPPEGELLVVNVIATTLTTLPFAQFKRSPNFYFVYDAVYLVCALAFVATLHASGWRSPVQDFAWWLPLMLPVATYVVIMAHVFIHNASHGNFPKSINRIVGEICGVIVLTKFASWEIVHRRHHRYSDDPERDPHPAERHYWRYAWNTLINVEKQLQQQYFDLYGETPETRRHEKIRSALSFVSGVALLFGWLTLLGAPMFFVLYLPAFFLAALFVIFFNWAGHNAHKADGPIEPANLDHGIFWILNRMFFGIFYHGNHHKMAMLFNPMRMPVRERSEPTAQGERDEAEAA
ncbi:Fatty acid desaturase [Sandaracinus amylolyticus]|nr:Fatty acid desaturase [Sandaracinus amylolyticus]